MVLVAFAIAVVAALAVTLRVVLVGADARDRKASGGARRPNILMIMTDDQNSSSMRYLPAVRSLIGSTGVTLTNNIVSFPLCCPSRASFLTGAYAHNDGVHANVAPYGGAAALKDPATTFPAALRKAGYSTIHVGKYLNGYGLNKPVTAPPGWSDWNGAIDPTTYRYFGFSLLENGKERSYGRKPADYQTDVETRIAVSKIRAHENSHQPFFLNLAYLAPHSNSTESGDELDHVPVPAPRDAGTLAGHRLPASAAFNEADVSDKPRWLRALPSITPAVDAKITQNYVTTAETLGAVNDGVTRIMKTLQETDQLRNTVVIFTSDNGYFFGEHRIPAGKARFYEPSVRVPLVIRGPGIARGVTQSGLVANVDLAPTILQLAGAKSLRTMDGTSMVPLLRKGGSAPADRSVLLEGNNVFKPDLGVRTARYAYFALSSGEEELYDLRIDPDQLQNRAGDPAYTAVQADLAAELQRLKTCSGSTCRSS